MGKLVPAAALPWIVLVIACGEDGGGGAPDAVPGVDAIPVDAGPPTVATVLPLSGYYPGGQRLTITGADFGDAPTVTIGGRACADVAVSTATQLSCVAPSGA